MNELDRLMEGNKRYVDNSLAPKDVKAKREQTQEGQKPFVTVVSCSDSRVVPEYIFDENLGEIFVNCLLGSNPVPPYFLALHLTISNQQP